ncbi:ATP-binding cassette domain-containing protein [Yinghuangia sp. ASG 101]|uniref:ABC transporter ATP-binding protein n=1 Tax=Yinghuangia sp. ASG 101 TaxID=2896848 RepID=UPI001E2C924A|nr:ATP-binding cassette domain-containing protein [Yinghuangia sp. ASG 101]UGQ13857.1 ATP-binding cassette domain-containing protein [Yinghuangia sp. ASG 101]
MLDLVQLGKNFGDKVVLDDLSFSVAPGQMFGFVGTNGAGKTTTMRITLGVLAADRGEVRWRGRPADAAVRRRWGYMPEERGLYAKMRILDQLVYFAELHGMPRTEARGAAEAWLRTLGVSGAPGDRLETLSLGNQQRVQLAAALVHGPELLVLDEPFSGLDPVGVDVMAQALRGRVDEGVSVVFSSHQLDLVERLCDAVGIIKDGRMHAVGTVRELRGDNRAVRYRVGVDAPGGWAAGVPGVTVLADDADGALVELHDGTSEQGLLDAARAAGRVRAFTPVSPSLTELFREVVNGAAPEDAADLEEAPA